MAARAPRPVRARVRMYQVGFGDCFLLTFEYRAALADGRRERHILIDFGSTHRPKAGGRLAEVAGLIEEHTGGRLDVLVVTHRHRDHLSGLGAKASGEVIERLEPALVVRPWTEDPRAASDAEGPLGERSRRFAGALAEAQAFAGTLAGAVAEARGARAELGALALMQLGNQAAIDRLDRLAERAAAAYLFYGADSGIEALVPGVRVRVLGPPTLEQWPEVAGQRAEDPEFWVAHRRLLDRALAGTDLAGPRAEELREAAGAGEEPPPGPARWLIDRMRGHQAASLRRVVGTLDDALNNTSVILLFEAGGRRLLFPGDAQIEAWSYALTGAPDRRALRRALGAVDLYKVGHHGSRNATPRSLFALWGDGPPERPMAALMSTLSGVHGRTEATHVPRATLVAALERRARLFSTDGLAPERPFIELAAPLRGEEPFSLEESAGE